MTTEDKGSLVLIKSGGGSKLTQSYPTNHHTFHSEVLCKPEDAEKWKEVTAAQAAAMEAADNKFAEQPSPSPEFLNSCRYWFGGTYTFVSTTTISNLWRYNESTGFFEFADLADITLEEMRTALSMAPLTQGGATLQAGSLYVPGLRFAIIARRGSNSGAVLAGAADAKTANGVETLVMAGTFSNYPRLSDIPGFFKGAKSLKTVVGKIYARWSSAADSFSGCSALETIQIHALDNDLDLSSCAKLSQESVEYMVRQSMASKLLTVTLPADVFAGVSDEILTLAAEKQIALVSA